MAGSFTPMTWRSMRAGFDSGPMKLKTVGMPSSARTGPAWRMAGWKARAKQKPRPASTTQRVTPAPSRSMPTPSASSRSNEPLVEVALRLPCLQMCTPAPATTKQAMVDTLRALWRRVGPPPVPTMSTSGAASAGMVIGSDASSMASTMPATSSTASPFMRRATMYAAIWASWRRRPGSRSWLPGPRRR